jgi:hypothetical protein
MQRAESSALGCAVGHILFRRGYGLASPDLIVDLAKFPAISTIRVRAIRRTSLAYLGRYRWMALHDSFREEREDSEAASIQGPGSEREATKCDVASFVSLVFVRARARIDERHILPLP